MGRTKHRNFIKRREMILKIFTSNRSDGSMGSGQKRGYIKDDQSRTTFLKKNGINPANTTLNRIKYEGDNYRRYFTLDDSDRGDGITRESTIVSDALVVTKPNHAIFLLLADCIGAVLYDSAKNILMVSHLGRRHLEQNGGVESVKYLVKKHGIDPKDLKAWLSPAAGQGSYPLFAFGGRSLHDVAVEQLRSAGVLLENIEVSTIDTTQDENYYSHSQFLKGKQVDDGRFAVVAVTRE
jgi:hypothetical protein